MIRVRLYSLIGTGLIIKAKTGIVWSNQAGGNYCLQPECEGVLVPFGNDETLDNRVISLSTELWALFSDHYGVGLVHGLADAFERLLEEYAKRECATFSQISLDRSMLAESCEAWVHVLYRPDPAASAPFEGIGAPPFKAVLTWCNSDERSAGTNLGFG